MKPVICLVLSLAAMSGLACACRAPDCSNLETLAIWKEPAPAIADDPHNPCPAPWTGVAAVVAGKRTNREYNDPCILVLASVPRQYDIGKLTTSQLLRRMRYASPCDFIGGFGGRWLYFKRSRTSVFVFVKPSGGTVDDVLCLSHDISYDTEQKHYFWPIFSGDSRIPVLLADANNDGELELLVGSAQTISGTSPKMYDIIDLSHSDGRKIGTISEETAWQLPNVEELVPLSYSP